VTSGHPDASMARHKPAGPGEPPPRRPSPPDRTTFSERIEPVIQPRATWSTAEQHVGRWTRLVPARLSNHGLIAIDAAIPNDSTGLMLAKSRYPSSYVSVSLGSNDLLELVVHAETGYAELAEFSERIGAPIPTAASCCADGEGVSHVRHLMRVSNFDSHVIVEELRYAERNTFDASPVPGFLNLSVRFRGLALLPIDPTIPNAPQALLEYLKRYRQELAARSWERLIKEQAAASERRSMPSEARRLRYGVHLMHRGTYLNFPAGTIVEEQEVLDAIAAADPDALVAIDADTKLRDLRPGEIRYKTRFFGTVPGLGMISAEEGKVIEGTDPSYIAHLRAAGAQLEVYGGEPARQKQAATA